MDSRSLRSARPQPTVRPAARRPSASHRDPLLSTLVALMNGLTVEADDSSLLRSALEQIVLSLQLSGGCVFLAGEDGELHVAAEQGRSETGPASALASAVLDQPRPLIQDLPGGGMAGTPLRSPGAVLGALVLREDAAGAPSLDEETLEVLGRQLGAALHNARVCAQLRASANRVELLRSLVATVTSGRDLATIVPPFAEQMQKIIAFDRLACGFVNETGDYIEMASHPEGTSWGLGAVLPVVGSGPGFVALNRKPVLQVDLVREHRFIEDMRLLEDGLRSYVLAAARLPRADGGRPGSRLGTTPSSSTIRRWRGCRRSPTRWRSPSTTCVSSRRRARCRSPTRSRRSTTSATSTRRSTAS